MLDIVEEKVYVVVTKLERWEFDSSEKAEKFASIIDNEKFTYGQLNEIYLGINKGLDVSFYALPILKEEQMKEVRIGLEKGLDVSWYNKSEFNCEQMQMIQLGLEKGLDVSIYAKPEYDYKQMGALRFGLLNNVDVSIYANQCIGGAVMNLIANSLVDNIELIPYVKKGFSINQLEFIYWCLEKGIDANNIVGLIELITKDIEIAKNHLINELNKKKRG